MIHRREDIQSSWANSLRLIIFGHSHRPEFEWPSACLLLNPGSCGPRRFSYPFTLAILTVSDGRLRPEIASVEQDSVGQPLEVPADGFRIATQAGP